MTVVGAYEAKTHFSQLLERVARGEQITVTRHGVPVMTLHPAETRSITPPEQVIADIKAFRQGRKLDENIIQAMIQEGRL